MSRILRRPSGKRPPPPPAGPPPDRTLQAQRTKSFRELSTRYTTLSLAEPPPPPPPYAEDNDSGEDESPSTPPPAFRRRTRGISFVLEDKPPPPPPDDDDDDKKAGQDTRADTDTNGHAQPAPPPFSPPPSPGDGDATSPQVPAVKPETDDTADEGGSPSLDDSPHAATPAHPASPQQPQHRNDNTEAEAATEQTAAPGVPANDADAVDVAEDTEVDAEADKLVGADRSPAVRRSTQRSERIPSEELVDFPDLDNSTDNAAGQDASASAAQASTAADATNPKGDGARPGESTHSDRDSDAADAAIPAAECNFRPPPPPSHPPPEDVVPLPSDYKAPAPPPPEDDDDEDSAGRPPARQHYVIAAQVSSSSTASTVAAVSPLDPLGGPTEDAAGIEDADDIEDDVPFTPIVKLDSVRSAQEDDSVAGADDDQESMPLPPPPRPAAAVDGETVVEGDELETYVLRFHSTADLSAPKCSDVCVSLFNPDLHCSGIGSAAPLDDVGRVLLLARCSWRRRCHRHHGR